MCRDISIHALRGEGDQGGLRVGHSTSISIHALRGEGDPILFHQSLFLNHFNPRPPWGGRRAHQLTSLRRISHFNPRPPWGGRHLQAQTALDCVYFNPRPPWGGRPINHDSLVHGCNFNPRPPWGGRRQRPAVGTFALSFQSTPSVGRATKIGREIGKYIGISIHALRGEGDRQNKASLVSAFYFNPRPPWGGRPERLSEMLANAAEFQSTPSVGRAT